MRKLVAALIALALAVAVVGCSSSDGSDGSKSTTTTAKAVTTTTSTTAPAPVAPEFEKYTDDQYSASMVTNLTSGSVESGDLVLTEDEAACVGPKWLAAMTADAIRRAKITPDQVADPSFDGSKLGLAESQAQAMVDAFAPCDVDIYKLFVDTFTPGLTEAQQACVNENLEHDLLDALLVKTFSGQESDKEFEALTEAIDTACHLQ